MPPENLEPGEPPPPPPRGWPAGFGVSAAEREAILLLAHAELIPRDVHRLVWQEGSAAGARARVLAGDHGAERARKVARDPGPVRRAVEACGGRLVTPADPGFPEQLLDLPDPPGWLFVRGTLPPAARWVAVVGARRCSAYGREVATALGRDLATAGLVVVSGAASGIDSAAHRGALGADGSTVAVLGSGIDVPYPKGNRRLISEIAERGAVVSEYPPGTQPLKHRFPSRNRLVAALGELTVVVEGAEGSGSRITAEFAMDLGRDVFGVPGPVTSPLSAMPHGLIRVGAGLARDAGDVLEALELTLPEAVEHLEVTPAEAEALEALQGAPSTVEEVVARSGLPAGEALAALTGLELRGLVRGAGGRYERTLRAGAR